MNATTPSVRPAPICGLLSLVLTPAALLLAFVATELFQGFVTSPPPGGVARVIVLLSMACIVTGWIAGILGLVRRERLPWLAVVGWTLSLGIIALMRHLDAND